MRSSLANTFLSGKISPFNLRGLAVEPRTLLSRLKSLRLVQAQSDQFGSRPDSARQRRDLK